MDGKPTVIRISIPTNVYFLSGIRDFTFDAVHNVAGFSEQWAHRIQTVVDELVNNAIEHGSQPGEEIGVEFEIEEQHSIAVSVRNGPHGKTHLTATELNAKVAEQKQLGDTPRIGLRGRGITIIANWCDEVAFTDLPDGGLVARAKKYYHPEEWQGKAQHAAGQNVIVLEV